LRGVTVITKDWIEKVKRFSREVITEMKRVVWPDRRQTTAFTVVVLVSVGLMSGFIWLLDLILGQAMSVLHLA
jgi:preprotein translocase subunit SecE